MWFADKDLQASWRLCSVAMKLKRLSQHSDFFLLCHLSFFFLTLLNLDLIFCLFSFCPGPGLSGLT